jgi:hypothetical protein
MTTSHRIDDSPEPLPEHAGEIAPPDAADGGAARAEKPSPFAGEDWGPRAWGRLLRDVYLTFDRRTLGFSRILLGFLLLMDVIHRGAAWRDLYSSVGVLPTPLNLQRPQAWGAFTIFNAFNTPGELQALWVLMAVNAVCLMVGYRTKVAQMVALVLHVGMNGRVLLVENGGYVVNNLLLLWTLFLPLGDRFSVDALRASLKRRREATAEALNDRSDMLAPGKGDPYVSVLGAVLVVQIAAIYYFNVIHKTGPAWRNGTAVHYVLYVDRMTTPIIGLLRDHVPNVLILFMTRSTMAFEAGIPVLLLQPLAKPWARRGVVFMMCALHIAFGTTFVLGVFSWSACLFATLLFTRDDWEIASATMRRARRARTVVFNPRSGGALLVCRLLKRLDRFELLTFAAVGEGEALPLGIGVQGQATRAGMLADLLAALPLGPIVAWIPRLPGVRNLVEALLGAIEARDVSGFLGLRAGDAPAVVDDAVPETPPVPFALVVLSVVVVGLAVAAAVYFDRPLPGVLAVLATVVVTALGATWYLFPVVTTRLCRRVAFGSLREFLVLALFAGAVNQALVELWCFNRRFKTPQPEVLRLLSHKMRFLQGWFMFSPNPVMDDGTIVVDALTVDGRHVDPFTGKEPYWELDHPLGLTQIWCDYFNRIQLPANTAYREAMKDYMYRLPQRSGHPGDAIVSGDVFWVKKMNPRWNETATYNYERAKLFSFESSAAQPHASR